MNKINIKTMLGMKFYKYIRDDELKISLKKYLYLQTQEPKTELEEHEMFRWPSIKNNI